MRYKVVYGTEIDAESSLDAAKLVYEIMLDSERRPPAFLINGEDGKIELVDLGRK